MTRGCRRKATATTIKKWMVVSEIGESRIEDIDKHTIMRRTGLPARDLRILDPLLSHPSSILGRDKAIVVNLEHIKAIITANEILMINSSNPFFLRFVHDLQGRVPSSNNHFTTPSKINDDVESICEGEGEPLLEDGLSPFLSSANGSPKWGNPKTERGVPPPVPKQLPFEFRALEACIESACTCLESETRRLEDEAYPALDELTSQISTLNLERVRQIKNRLVALSGRVQKVADQLEQLLDDDNDMSEMYLTQKLHARSLDQSSLKEMSNPEFEDISHESDESINSEKEKSYDPKPDIEELEMLLETYFAQINGILQKLSSLSEYVDDTEDYIYIMLDDKQNQLLQATVTLNILNLVVNAGIVVVGIFGMNIHIDLFDGQPHQFWETTSGTFFACVLLFLFSAWWVKKKYLLSQ